MNEYLKKEVALFERDENEELLPVVLELSLLEKTELVNGEEVIIKKAPKIKAIPIPRGKWKRILTLDVIEQDKLLLKEHVIEPKFTDKDYEAMKPVVMTSITEAITALTLDISQEKANKESRKKLTEAEEVTLKKKLKNANDNQSSSSMTEDTISST